MSEIIDVEADGENEKNLSEYGDVAQPTIKETWDDVELIIDEHKRWIPYWIDTDELSKQIYSKVLMNELGESNKHAYETFKKEIREDMEKLRADWTISFSTDEQLDRICGLIEKPVADLFWAYKQDLPWVYVSEKYEKDVDDMIERGNILGNILNISWELWNYSIIDDDNSGVCLTLRKNATGRWKLFKKKENLAVIFSRPPNILEIKPIYGYMLDEVKKVASVIHQKTWYLIQVSWS